MENQETKGLVSNNPPKSRGTVASVEHRQWDSPREALGYFFAHHAGPKLSQPRYTDSPRATGRTPWDASLIGALLRGHLGVKAGSKDDLALKEWATTPPARGMRGMGAPKPIRVRRIEERLRRLMRKHDLLRRRMRPKRTKRHEFTDAYSGLPMSTLIEEA